MHRLYLEMSHTLCGLHVACRLDESSPTNYSICAPLNRCASFYGQHTKWLCLPESKKELLKELLTLFYVS